MNISIHHFRLVQAIVKTGTLTKAAQILHLTQSALSHQLKEVEKETTIKIFNRGGRRLQLTEEGERFLQSAEKILVELQELKTDLKNFKSGKTGKLNISTQCYTTYHWLPSIIKEFKEKSPDIFIHINSEATHNPIDYLLKGELDVGIVKTNSSHAKIHYHPIFEDDLMVIMPADHALTQKRVIKIKDFHNEELIMSSYNAQDKDIVLIENLLQIEKVSPRIIHKVLYTDAIIEMVSSGLAIGLMANWIIQPYLTSHNIVARPLPPSISRRTWYAATSKQNTAINNFLDCLKSHFATNLTNNNTPSHKLEKALLVV